MQGVHEYVCLIVVGWSGEWIGERLISSSDKHHLDAGPCPSDPHPIAAQHDIVAIEQRRLLRHQPVVDVDQELLPRGTSTGRPQRSRRSRHSIAEKRRRHWRPSSSSSSSATVVLTRCRACAAATAAAAAAGVCDFYDAKVADHGACRGSRQKQGRGAEQGRGNQ